MNTQLIFASIAVFLSVMLILVIVLLVAKKYLVPSGNVKLTINGENTLEVESGSTLLNTLAVNRIYLSSACGGKGSCGQCKCQVIEGGGEILPSELPHFNRKQRQDHWRLGCQVKLKGDMSIVGPRPERKCLADEISKEIPEFCYRLKVRGGLTGYAQIYGKYNTSAYDKLRLDMMYIENYSPLLDIRLIILTLRIIFSKDSTEGIDVAMENQRRADELWRELDEENEEKEKGGAE